MIGLLSRDPLAFLVAFAASAFGLVIHNLFQAWLADHYGETAPRRYGFLTLEPRVHLDPLGLLFLALLGFGIPRLVPFNLRGRKGVWVALMGPLGFLVSGFVYLLFSRLLVLIGGNLDLAPLSMGLSVSALIMVGQAAIFLFPVPPLDGARMVYAAGSFESRRFMDQIGSYGPFGFLLIFMLLSFTGILGAVQQALLGLLLNLLHLFGL